MGGGGPNDPPLGYFVTVNSLVVRGLISYRLYFIMFQCALTGGAIRCVHIAHKFVVIFVILQHVPMLRHWERPVVVEYRTPVSLQHRTFAI